MDTKVDGRVREAKEIGWFNLSLDVKSNEYLKGRFCKNCGGYFYFAIKKGVSASFILPKVKCPHCECIGVFV